MPYTPDPIDVLAARLDDVEQRLAKLEAAPPPTGGTTPADEAELFLKKWAAVDAAEFQAKYGVAHGKPIPAMTAYDEAEAIYRARAFYSTQGFPGRRISTPNVAYDAVTVIAHATQATAGDLYETGYGLTDPDVCAYGFYVGLFDTQHEYQQSLGAGKWPRAYAGATLQSLLAANFSTVGHPSGG